MHHIRVRNCGRFGSLFEIGIALPKIGRNPGFGYTVDVSATHFIACESDSVSVPFTRNEDGHFDAESELWVEEGADVIVFGQVVNEPFIP